MKKANVMAVFVAITISAVLDFTSCKNDEPVQPHITSIQLAVEDVSCTEAWLKVSLTDANEPRTVAVQQNGQRVLTAHMFGSDSVFVVEGLLPRQAYSFVAERLRDTTAIDVSSPVQATTMDTTSHDFHFEVDTLGVTSSTLYDVAIINDTLAYAVGEIYLRDSTGQLDPQAYNLATWNGRGWILSRIQFFTICGQSNRTPYPASSVFAFGPTDVWIAMDGSQVARRNGSLQTSTMCLPFSFSIRKLWGVNPNSVYAVGDRGNIMYYDGTWQGVESGITLPVSDVFGAYDPTANETEVLALVSNANSPTGSKVLSIEDGTGSVLPSLGLSWGLDGIWFMPGRQYVVVGDGLWRTHSKESSWVRDSTLAPLHKTCIDGTGFSDIVVGGAFWYLIHYNGVSWRSYFPFASGSFTAVAMRNNLIIAVGGIGGRAIAVRGTR